ncbi:porin [Rhodobacterales bacterium HKCCA1065]|nr:porin [Rhodobacterales bacterium HKCCA1065]
MVATAGIASADVSLSGAARMGLTHSDAATVGTDNETQFSSRVRITGSGSTTTDGGIELGASMRFDQDGGNSDGTANGSSVVYASGAFGKITMGDVGGAHESATGDVAGVGFIGGWNEMDNYISTDKTALGYSYSVNGLSVFAAMGQTQANSNDDVTSFGVSYTFNGITAGVGVAEQGVVEDTAFAISGSVAGLSLKASFLDKDNHAVDSESAVSASYTMDALTMTAFTRTVDNVTGVDLDYTGVGVSYDMGGSATLAAGYVDGGADGQNLDTWDLGINFSF